VTAPRAADLPVGSVVVDDDRHLVWIAVPRRSSAYGRWSVSGAQSFVSDGDVDAALGYTAEVLRVGDGSARVAEARL
jgi:hypothetical protein